MSACLTCFALFGIPSQVSFGNVTSLISLPCYMSHASFPAEVRNLSMCTYRSA